MVTKNDLVALNKISGEKELKNEKIKSWNPESKFKIFLNERFNAVLENIFAGCEILKQNQPVKIEKIEIKSDTEKDRVSYMAEVKQTNLNSKEYKEENKKIEPDKIQGDEYKYNVSENKVEKDKRKEGNSEQEQINESDAKQEIHNKDEKNVKTKEKENKNQSKDKEVEKEIKDLEKLIKNLIALIKEKKIDKKDIEELLKFFKDRGMELKELLELVQKKEIKNVDDINEWAVIIAELNNIIDFIKDNNIVQKVIEEKNNNKLEIKVEIKQSENKERDIRESNFYQLIKKTREIINKKENIDSNRDILTEKQDDENTAKITTKDKEVKISRKTKEEKNENRGTIEKYETKLEDDTSKQRKITKKQIEDLQIKEDKSIKRDERLNINKEFKIEIDTEKFRPKTENENPQKVFLIEDLRGVRFQKANIAQTDKPVDIDLSIKNIKNNSNDNMLSNFSSKNDKSNMNNANQTRNLTQNNTNQTLNTKQIMDQIIQQARVVLKDEVSSMSLKLKPEFLGRLELQLELKDSKLTAKIYIENNLVMNAIKDELDELKKTLKEMNIDVENFELMAFSENYPGDKEQGFTYEDGGGYDYYGNVIEEAEETTGSDLKNDVQPSWLATELNYLA
ncbi:MAG: flagellar hook-length control protein FliK [Candidatus Hydrogenedentota bacterium]